MKKRLFCLLLSLVLVLPLVLSACSGEEDSGADVSEDLGAQTITMRMVTERRVCNTDKELEDYLAELKEQGKDENSAEYKEMLAVKANYDRVEAEFSRITKSKYNVNVDFIFYTWDEYFGEDSEKKIENTMDKYALETVNKERAKRAIEKYVSDFQAAFPDSSYPLKAIGKNFLKNYPEFEPYIDLDTVFEDEDEKDKVAEDQYKVNEITGIKELVYPAADENQLDIIYISGFDMYNEFVENEWIIPLDEHINTTGKELRTQIPSALLDGVKKNGITYAIPNNTQMGEYTYMMVDQELFDRYHYIGQNYPDHTQVKDVIDLKDFLEDIAENHPDVLPIDSSYKECMDLFVWYWNIDYTVDEDGNYTYSVNKDNEFSLIGSLYGDPKNAGRGQIELGFDYLFESEEYQEIFFALKEYEFNGYYKQDDETRGDAAVKFMKGNYDVQSQAAANNGVYTDENGNKYYPYVVKYPVADEQALYGNMYAISANSQHTKACMEVLTLINTDAEARNILQYGIEGEDYTIDENGMLKRTQDQKNSKGEIISHGTYYKMDVNKTGNCFIAHPDEGQAPDYWENAKHQNNDAVIDPLLGFDFNMQLASNGQLTMDNQLIDYAGLDADPNVEGYDSGDLGTLILNRINEYSAKKDMDGLKNFITKDVGEEMCKTENSSPEGVAGLAAAHEGKPFFQVVVQVSEDKQTINKPSVNMAKLTSSSTEVSKDDKNGPSPYAIYYSWLVQYNYLPTDSSAK